MPSPSPQGDLYQQGPSDSDLFMRRWSLTLIGPGGEWTVSDTNESVAQSGGTSTIQDAPRIVFQTRQINFSTRGTLEVTVSNLKLQNLSNLKQLYNRVVLRAGYQNGKFGVIFDGMIVYFRQGRDQDLVTTYLMIFAQDGDVPYNRAVAAFSLSSGQKVKDAQEKLTKSMTDLGARVRDISGTSEVPFIRGRTYYGMAVDNIRKHNQMYIQNGNITVYDSSKTNQAGDERKIDSMHGLVGMPEVTANGVEFNILVDPDMQIHQTVVLDQSSINQYGAGSTVNFESGGSTGVQGPNFTGEPIWFANLAADGRYSVWVIEHNGDSRGQPWYSHIVAYALGMTPGLGSNLLNYNLGPTDQQIADYNKQLDLPNFTERFGNGSGGGSGQG